MTGPRKSSPDPLRQPNNPPATTTSDSTNPDQSTVHTVHTLLPNSTTTSSAMWSSLATLPPTSIYNQPDFSYDTNNDYLNQGRKRKAEPDTYPEFQAFSAEAYNENRGGEPPFMTWPYVTGQLPSMPLFASNIFYNQGSDDHLGMEPGPNYLGQQDNTLRITTTNTITTEVKRGTSREEITKEEPGSPVIAEICTKQGCTHQARFTLREQPKPKQRKSYRNENRYLLPNPTQVVMTPGETRSQIRSGTCKVKLLDGASNKLPRQSSHYLENTEGTLTTSLENNQSIFDFALKIRQNSGPDKFRLCFTVKYDTTDGVKHKEKIISTPFLVQSNKSFFSKDPKMTAVHPSVGLYNRPTEIWIKGRDFNEKGVSVQVGGLDAAVTEVQPNLIVAIAPARNELTSTTRVPVNVFNVFKQKTVPSEQECEFTYIVAGGDGRIHVDQLFAITASPNKT